MWSQVVGAVCSSTANKYKNLRFHFHVYKLAFGFSPHRKPVVATVEVTQLLPILPT